MSAISDADAERVGEFLHTYLNPDVSAERWVRSMRVPWRVDEADFGLMLLDEDTIVGAQLAYYSKRTIDGRRERFCNLGAWCVLPDYRFHSLRLLKALLKLEDYHFVDLTPIPQVAAINARLGFRFLDTTTVLVPNLPVPTWPRGTVSEDRSLIERTLTGDALALYRDHASTEAARHALLLRDGQWCYVMFRWLPGRRVRFASILYVSDPEVFRARATALGRHLLLRHGAVATLAEDRIVTRRPRLAFRLRRRPRKMFRSPSLGAGHIDDLYSELVCQAW